METATIGPVQRDPRRSLDRINIEAAAGHEGKNFSTHLCCGSAQQALYQIAILFHEKRVKPFLVYLDSPWLSKSIKSSGIIPIFLTQI